MKGLKIAAGIAMAIGIFLLLCVVGEDDYYIEMEIMHKTNYLLAVVGLALIVPAPFILNIPERHDHGRRKEF